MKKGGRGAPGSLAPRPPRGSVFLEAAISPSADVRREGIGGRGHHDAVPQRPSSASGGSADRQLTLPDIHGQPRERGGRKWLGPYDAFPTLRLERTPRFAFPALTPIRSQNYAIKTRKGKLVENLVHDSARVIGLGVQFQRDEADLLRAGSAGASVPPLLHLDVLQPEQAFDRCTALVADHPVPARQPDAIDFAQVSVVWPVCSPLPVLILKAYSRGRVLPLSAIQTT